MQTNTLLYSPGQRVLIRDAEWRVRRVDATTSSHFALSVTGVSEIVRGREAVFLTAAEKTIEVLDPATTKLVTDDSQGLSRTRLHLESLLRQIPPTGYKIALGHRAAMDMLPFQLVPTDLALRQPRQRILIADSVGLGKTLEAGILVAELARRGRAQRILVVTAKSLLTQFQKEWWSRFTLPLVRLDSIGLQRVRNRIPTHQNPFYFYDRSIISIDTLKQDNQFRNYLEQAYWDVIVIDEAHNVAKRGGGNQRNRLADLLATRSDTLVLLSATPHDGRRASFASLMNLLDATAIADPDDYGPEDIRGLFVRRFRKDVSAQLKGQVPERILVPLKATASEAEQKVFDTLHALTLSTEVGSRDGSVLFRTTLLKSFLSSPMACASTLRERLRKLEKGEIRGGLADTEKLTELLSQVEAITKLELTKYQLLVHHLRAWKPSATDRVVIFTERIDTVDWLQENLPMDLKLKANQISRIDGGLDDIALMQAVEEFGQEDSPVRLLVASDVAAEGINLHYQCHRLIHFDLPWSLMVFSQRNGRVDRYGQKHQPELAYLITASQGTARSDERVLEVLLEKDKQAQESIGDPSALLGVYTQEEQEAMVAKAIESAGESGSESGGAGLPESDLGFDPFELLLQSTETQSPEPETRILPSLFENDYSYCAQALKHLAAEGETLQYETHAAKQEINISVTRDEQSDDLYGRYRQLPPEILPDKGGLHLSANPTLVMQAIESARKEGQWPQTQYLWPLHPVVEWINDRVQGSFGRHEAPVVHVPGLGRGEALVLISGLVPNRLGHPLVHQWVGALFRAGSWSETLDLEASLKRCGLNGESVVNATVPADIVKENLAKLLVPALACARAAVEEERKRVLELTEPELAAREARLQALLAKHDAQIEIKFAAGLQQVNTNRKHERRDQVRRAFEAHRQWLRDAHDLEPHAHLQVLAVCCGRP